MPKNIWRIHRAMSYRVLSSLLILLIHINDHMREFHYINNHQGQLGFSGEIFEAMDVIVNIAVGAALFSAIAIVRNAFARRYNKRQLRSAADNN